jgi:hypothetical protein
MALARRLGKKSKPQSFDEQLAQLQKLYEFIEPNEVIAVLALNPQLIKLLREARREIEKYLPGSKLTLEHEGEIEDNEIRPLWVTVYPPEAMTNVSSRIREFKDKWYLKSLSTIRGDFHITYKYPNMPSNWDAFKNLVGKIEGPEDWSAETDHYRLGTPKRHNKDET